MLLAQVWSGHKCLTVGLVVDIAGNKFDIKCSPISPVCIILDIM